MWIGKFNFGGQLLLKIYSIIVELTATMTEDHGPSCASNTLNLPYVFLRMCAYTLIGKW